MHAYAIGIENGCEVTHKIELTATEFERDVYPVLVREYIHRRGWI